MQSRLARYKRKHGTTEGFDPDKGSGHYTRRPRPRKAKPRRLFGGGYIRKHERDCSQPLTPNTGHYQAHYKRGDDPCEASRIERAWARSGHSNKELKGTHNPQHSSLPRTIYRILFEDGSAYFGETARTLPRRLNDHRSSTHTIGRKLRTGMEHKIEPLFQVENLDAAKRLEAFIIRLRKKTGKPILNARHVSERRRRNRSKRRPEAQWAR